jgi:hypothetical protein
LVKKYLILSFALLSHALGIKAQNDSAKDSSIVLVTLDNFSNQNKEIDSVYLIFDKYERNGAGVVKQVFYPVNNRVAVAVPKGKYYVDVFCLGTFNDSHLNQVVRVRRRKQNKVCVKLKYEAFFTPGFADIPKEKFDFANLSITRPDSFR